MTLLNIVKKAHPQKECAFCALNFNLLIQMSDQYPKVYMYQSHFLMMYKFSMLFSV